MAEDSIAITLTTLGGLLLLGLAAQAIGTRTHVPRVTILILLGIAVGPMGFNLLPDMSRQWFDFITTVALTMVGFLLGGKLNLEAIESHGRDAFVLSLVITLGTFAMVLCGMLLIGISTPVALILAGISLATDPIATLDVLDHSESKSPLRAYLPEIVALDDAWGLLLFSIVMTLIPVMTGRSFAPDFLLEGAVELVGSVGLGIALGLPMALLSGRIKQGEPTLVEALGMVMLCAGLSLYLEVSYLLAAIVMGMIIASTARHHKFAFHEIEHIEWPFLMLFLLMVGASFTPGNWAALSAAGIGYVIFRVLGRIAGAHLYRFVPLDNRERTFLGISLLPQAGVALGTAIYAYQQFPQITQQIVTITIGATIFFELVGPMLTQWSLQRTDQHARAVIRSGHDDNSQEDE